MELVGDAVNFLEKHKPKIKTDSRNDQFCSYISEYKCNLFRLAKSILHDDTDAEDAVSEAILIAYEHLPTLRNIQSFKPWIIKILINESYAISNRRKRLVRLDELEIADQASINENKELWHIVNGLDHEFRTVTILYYYEDLSLKEICKVLDLPMGTVKSRLSRARHKLKDILADEGGL